MEVISLISWFVLDFAWIKGVVENSQALKHNDAKVAIEIHQAQLEKNTSTTLNLKSEELLWIVLVSERTDTQQQSMHGGNSISEDRLKF